MDSVHTNAIQVEPSGGRQRMSKSGRWLGLSGLLGCLTQTLAASPIGPSPTDMFDPVSTPAHDIYHLSLFVLSICAAIFILVFSLIIYAAVKYRRRPTDDGSEPPQIYGSNQVELAWTVIPILIVVVLFLASARVIHAV